MTIENKIIIIDDDMELLEELSETLSSVGYTVFPFSDDKVINKIEMIKPDAILLDLKIPGKDGFQILEELRKKPEGKDVPVIIMTGHYEQDEMHAAVERLNIFRCLLKPLYPPEIIALLEDAIEGTEKDWKIDM